MLLRMLFRSPDPRLPGRGTPAGSRKEREFGLESDVDANEEMEVRGVSRLGVGPDPDAEGVAFPLFPFALL